MTNYFYFVGFLYLAELTKSFFDFFKKRKPDDTEVVTLDLENGMNMDQLLEAKDKLANSKTSYWPVVFSICFFIWTLIAYYSGCAEKMWFAIDIGLSTISFIISLLIGISIGLTSVYGNKYNESGVKNNNVNKNKTLPVFETIGLIKIFVISYILINHFFLT